MISVKFVKIAREIIFHIRKGNKLYRGGLSSNDSNICPLGVICLNHGKIITPDIFPDKLYDYAHNVTNTNSDFEEGFDDSCFSLKMYKTEDYNIGWALGKQCDKRNWIL